MPKFRLNALFLKNVNTINAQPRETTADGPRPPSAIVQPHPISKPKRLLLYPSSPENRLLFFSREKCMPSHPSMQKCLNCLKVQPPHPCHSGFNEAALISVVWVCVPLGIKLHTRGGYVCMVVS